MPTQEQESQVARASVNQPIKAADSTTNRELSLEMRAKGVWTLAPSPPLAMQEEHPEDAEFICRLHVLAKKRS
jgi:hypothetical protein